MAINFGKPIAYIRQNRGLTQSQFGSQIGVSKAAVSAYESNSRLPSHDVLIKISTTFKVSMDYLYCFSSDELYENYVSYTGITDGEIDKLFELVSKVTDYVKLQKDRRMSEIKSVKK